MNDGLGTFADHHTFQSVAVAKCPVADAGGIRYSARSSGWWIMASKTGCWRTSKHSVSMKSPTARDKEGHSPTRRSITKLIKELRPRLPTPLDLSEVTAPSSPLAYTLIEPELLRLVKAIGIETDFAGITASHA